MSGCEEIVIWKVPANSRFCAESSAVTSADSGTVNQGTPTADYACVVNIAPTDSGPTILWDNSDLAPGPAKLALTDQGYVATATLAPGPSKPTVSFHAWIEAPGGGKPFECTWTDATPNVVITII